MQIEALEGLLMKILKRIVELERRWPKIVATVVHRRPVLASCAGCSHAQ
jgi:hypothetical protein